MRSLGEKVKDLKMGLDTPDSSFRVKFRHDLVTTRIPVYVKTQRSAPKEEKQTTKTTTKK